MARKHRVMVHDGEKRVDPQEELYLSMGAKPHRDQLMVPHLIHECFRALHKAGFELAHEHVDALRASALVCFAHMPENLKALLAAKVPDHARSILKALGVDDARHATVATCYLINQAVEDGVIQDVNATAVLTALCILEEAKGDGKEMWDFRPQLIHQAAGKARNRAQMIGYL